MKNAATAVDAAVAEATFVLSFIITYYYYLWVFKVTVFRSFSSSLLLLVNGEVVVATGVEIVAAVVVEFDFETSVNGIASTALQTSKVIYLFVQT